MHDGVDPARFENGVKIGAEECGRLLLFDHGLAGDRPLAGRDHGRNGGRQIDIDAAAEPDQAEAFAGAHLLAGPDIAFDAPRHQPGDLHHADALAAFGYQADALALIMFAGLVQGGIEEFTGPVLNFLDAARHRHAVHMHIEHIHKYRNPVEGTLHFQLDGRFAGADGLDNAIGGADHQAGAHRRHPGGIAEKVGAPEGQDQPGPAQRLPNPGGGEGHRREHGDKRPSGPVDGWHRL